MNLSQLYYFRKLAELQHYTKAAKELFITQPTLSGSISSLSHETLREDRHAENQYASPVYLRGDSACAA